MDDKLIQTVKFFYDLTDDQTFYIETFRVNTKVTSQELTPDETYHKLLELLKNNGKCSW